MPTIRTRLLAITTFAFALAASAQDYPYEDDMPSPEAPSAPSNNAADSLPVERPDTVARGGARKRLPALYRFAVKAGAEYTFYQSPSTTVGVESTTDSGVGFDLLGSGGWDLPYQPIFLEFETGYRSLFFTFNDKVHIVPLRFGVFRRLRIGRENLFKFGVIPSLDLRFTSNELGETEFLAGPALSVAAVWEFGALLVQPELTIYRLGSSKNYVSFGLMGGSRF